MAEPRTGGIGVLTSGGDAPGMNAALRAVVRAALGRGVPVFGIREGYRGMVDGGDCIRPLTWGDVGGIMQRAGTAIGTARCKAFLIRDGRRQAARNLLAHGIDRLVVIGGDGSLTGADIFRQEWPTLLEELVAAGEVAAAVAERHPRLRIVGLAGSIDNDLAGTDMTIGADTALHRVVEALDALASTAASHQRTFVVEVMGRHCGYLALMGAVAGGADWVLLPEQPPRLDDWEARMCEIIRAGRAAGRRASIVVVAEGAHDCQGQRITSEAVRRALEERLGEDARVTILGHVQRGGTPSAFDRWMSTVAGYAAVDELLAAGPTAEPSLIGMRAHRVTSRPLRRCIEETAEVPQAIEAADYARALALRGGSFGEMYQTFQALAQALPTRPHVWHDRRLAVLHAGAPAPGMNTAVRAAVRLGLDRGYTMLAVRGGATGLVRDAVEELSWGAVDGWEALGGAEIGTSRAPLRDSDLPAVARTLAARRIDGLLIIGGWAGYDLARALHQAGEREPACRLPIICIPAAIDNNLPGAEFSIGADTALNTIVRALDHIKQSAVAVRRCFVVEVTGEDCGYLALLGALASGAEQAYLPELGLTLADLERDLAQMAAAFARGKRLYLVLRNEGADADYTTETVRALFSAEARGRFDVRQAVLGHLQEGGNPSPFDRVQATRLAARAVAFLDEQVQDGEARAMFAGIRGSQVALYSLEELPALTDAAHRRPREQWWLDLRAVAEAMAHEPAETMG